MDISQMPHIRPVYCVPTSIKPLIILLSSTESLVFTCMGGKSIESCTTFKLTYLSFSYVHLFRMRYAVMMGLNYSNIFPKLIK